MRITVACYRWLGGSLAHLLVLPIVAYFFLTDAAGRRASLAYLRRVAATPEGARTLGPEPGRRHVFRHFLEFGRAILDRVGFWLGEPDRFELRVQGREELDRVHAEKRGALVLGSHLGSFDAMRLLAALHSPITVHVLMYTRHAARINAIFEELRALRPGDPHVRVIEIAPGGVSHVLEARACVGRGDVVAVLADRVPPSESQRVSRVRFLGGSAELPQGPFLLAGLLGCPVLLMVGLRRGSGAYEIHVERLSDGVELPRDRRDAAVTEQCQVFADRLAAWCLRAPYQWFNFHDFWKEEDAGVRH
jgi:predicted LPLAT superfamily acyltransferase